jgi:trehalose-6-phosphate synthase
MARFVVVYHRLPFEEVVVKGEKVLREPKSPNGIIPTLKGFFRHFDDGLWLAWNKVPEDSLGKLSERRQVASSPSMQVQCVGLTESLINSFYHRTSKAALWPIPSLRLGYSSVTPYCRRVSIFTGAAIELDEALRTHPYSARSMLDAIVRAIDMPDEAARAQMLALGRRVQSANLASWTQEMIATLKAA